MIPPSAPTGTVPAASSTWTYRPALDGLRGVAVLMVMAYHAGLAPGGFIGVDIFFVISGYLITGLLLQEWDARGVVSLKNFYARRALRLLPALVTLLLVLLFVPRLFGTTPLSSVLIVLFYAANWVSAFRLVDLGILSHTWSLAIEEQFYAFWPPLLALLLALKFRRRWILGIVLLGIVTANVLRAALWEFGGPQNWTRLYYGLDTRMDSVLLGCAVGLAACGNLPWRTRLTGLLNVTSIGAALVLAVVAYQGPNLEIGVFLSAGTQLLVCVSATVLLGVLTSPARLASVVLENPALIWVGRISYGLYLWHVPVFHGLLNEERMFRWGVEGTRLQLLRFAVSFAIAAASFYVIELPMLRLKKRFRSEPASVTAPTEDKKREG